MTSGPVLSSLLDCYIICLFTTKMPFPNKVTKTKGQGVSKGISLCECMFMYVQVHMYVDALDVAKGQRDNLGCHSSDTVHHV